MSAPASTVVPTPSLSQGMWAPWCTAASMVNQQQYSCHRSEILSSPDLETLFQANIFVFSATLTYRSIGFIFVEAAAVRMHWYPISSFCLGIVVAGLGNLIPGDSICVSCYRNVSKYCLYVVEAAVVRIHW